jgi:hypothetical protein|tara:strand:- start:43 stop:585 length:543 start_codon:yes stop_codon:yes gene_type:complete
MSKTATKGKANKVPGVRFYVIRNILKEKAASGDAAPGEAGGISIEAIKAAEAEFQKMSEDYPDWVQSLVEELMDSYRRCIDTPELRHEKMAVIHDIAHDMKGQGGTFGYPLITDFGESLYKCTHKSEQCSDNLVGLIKAHIDGMKAVINGRISGDGGEIGKELLESLNQAIQKYSSEETT